MRFESHSEDGRIIGYRLSSFDYSSDTVIPTIILPAKFSGLPVVSIGYEAFEGIEFIERIIVPENIQFIEYGAFRNSSIQEIFLPKSLKTIRGEAFNNTNLETIHFAADSQLREIHDGVFRNSKITSIALPRTLEYIGGNAFENTPLSLVHFPLASQLNFLGDGSFSNTLLTNVTLPEGLRTIRGYAFENVPTLTNISLPSTVTFIGEYAFSGTGLTSVQFGAQSQLLKTERFIFGNPNDDNLIPLIKNSSTEMVIIGPILAAYKGNANNNQPLVIPEGIRVIMNEFNHTANTFIKSSITFPTTLKFIGQDAFQDATIHSDLLFPDMHGIGERAFQYATVSGKLTFQNILFINSDAFLGSTIDEVIFNPTTLGSLVSFGSNIFRFSSIDTLRMGEGYLEIPNTFTATSSIKHMFFPDSIKQIRFWAIGSGTLETLTFAGTSLIEDVSSEAVQFGPINNSPWYLTKRPYISLKNYLVFFDVTSLISPFNVSIPNGITAIGYGAFTNAQSFATLTLNEVNFIATNAFYRWNVNAQFSSPLALDNLNYIGSNLTFNYETLISNGGITFGNNIQFDMDTIMKYGFSSYLFRLRLPFDSEGFQIIGNMLVGYNPSFDTTPTSVIIPNNIEIISNDAFININFGGPLTLSQNLKYIMPYAFYNSNFVEDISLPQGLLRLDYGVFLESNLTSVTIPASVTHIENDVFNIQTLTTIDFEDSSNLNIESGAFGYFDGESVKNIPTRLRKYLNGSFLIVDEVLLYYYGYQKEVVIPEGVVNFTSAAFDNRNDTVESIVLPSTARYFKSDLFNGLRNLINVDFSKVNAINYLGRNLFGYTRIRHVMITAAVLKADPHLFNRMPYLESYEINLVNIIEFFFNTDIDIVD